MPSTPRDDPGRRPARDVSSPDLEVPEPDRAETEVDELDEPVEVDLEAPEADASEQRTEVVEGAEKLRPTLPDEVDPADRVEQERDVVLDEDEYRP